METLWMQKGTLDSSQLPCISEYTYLRKSRAMSYTKQERSSPFQIQNQYVGSQLEKSYLNLQVIMQSTEEK